ncbi:MAG: hypothetical protein KGI59_03310 [Patescibacteria group bacterium]|nr:hypothetical protein [Patescibacteria group bacterium]MDE2172362.1 hypothetical protein [Patescibacteria group bacterium]
MKSYFSSGTVSKIILVLAIVLIALVIFQAGMIVGYHRGVFAGDWDGNYERSVFDPHSVFAPLMRDFSRGDVMNGHGTIGEITDLSLPTLMVKGPGTIEQVVAVSPTTTVRVMHMPATIQDLRTGEQIVVIGEPGMNGQINASFIRVIPAGTSSLPLMTAHQ